jgi:drug/metabolite transporter (DMT)-like permease
MSIASLPVAPGRSSEAWRGTVLVVVSAFAFSMAGFFVRLIDADVWTMLFWRGLFGGLFIAGYVLCRDGPLALATLRRIGPLGLVVAACSALATICFINALRETTVADVLAINATAPFVAAALAWAWTGERERTGTFIASSVALLGVIATVVDAVDSGRLLGNLLAIAMTVLISAMMVVIRRQRAVCMLPAAALSAFLCALLAWPWAEPFSVAGEEFGYLILFGTLQFGLGLLLLTLGTRLISATRSALIGTLETLLAPLVVWLAFGEVPSLMTCIGGMIILGAVVGDLAFTKQKP